MIKMFLLAIGVAVLAAPAWAAGPQFVVQASANSVHVEADYHVHGKTLALFNVQPAENLPNGQAAFIKNLVVLDSNGKPVKAKPTADGDWNLASGNQRMRISYDVEPGHDNYRWPAGKEEVAYRTPEGLFFTGYALFIVPADKMDSDIDVRFELPPQWRAATPWQSTGPQQFRASSRRELLVNALFLGTAYQETLREGGFELDLVLGQPYVADRNQFTRLLQGMLGQASQLFGGAPRRSRYLIIVNDGDSDGGAFEGSFSQLISGPATASNRVVWGNVMAHELLHFWNGLSLMPASENEEWFKEGFTDYLTSVALHRAGLFDQAWLFKRLESIYTRQAIGRFYQRSEASLQQAGHNKQPLRSLVYGGGAAVAIAVEATMRKASDGKTGVAELMRSLYAEFAQNGKPYAIDDIVRHIKKVSGADMNAFFTRHVVGNEYLRLEPYFDELGLTLAAFLEEAVISTASSAGTAQTRNYQAAFGQP